MSDAQDSQTGSAATGTQAAAHLAFSFRAEPGEAYLGPDWGVAQKHEFKQAVTDEIFARIPARDRDRWSALILDVDEHGGLEETAVRDRIRAELDSLQGFRIGLVGEALAAPQTVEYCWVGEKRVCKHDYALVHLQAGDGAAPEPWTVTARPAGTARPYTATLFVTLAWETPLG